VAAVGQAVKGNRSERVALGPVSSKRYQTSCIDAYCRLAGLVLQASWFGLGPLGKDDFPDGGLLEATFGYRPDWIHVFFPNPCANPSANMDRDLLWTNRSHLNFHTSNNKPVHIYNPTTSHE
jgi:hypothetical protein